jgi:large subunit ribosomal protein L13
VKTYFPKHEELPGNWYVVDATNMVLGRLASHIAAVLRGKTKPYYTPHLDLGDHVVVVNASKVLLTGKKAGWREYYHYTGYPGGLVTTKYADLMERMPERIIEQAVWGMLPHNRLGKRLIRKLKVYASSEHPHTAQKPQELKIK